MAEKGLKVQMMGSFAVYYGDEALTLKKAGGSKSVRLLQMLLLSLPGGIPKSELIANLYGWNGHTDTANSNKNLNNLVYRLKGQLASWGLPEDEYVEIRQGNCFFKSSLPLYVDTLQFEEAVEAARKKSTQDAQRLRLFAAANEMYHGELLPANQSDMWFFQKSNHLKKLYLETVEELEREFRKGKNYKALMALYTRAAAIYPFENWQVKLIRCNLEVYRYEEAMSIYRDTMELYAREMGTPPTREMQECFEEIELIDQAHHGNRGDLNSWKYMDKAFLEKKNDIKNAIFSEDDGKSAYYMTYPSFVDYCRLVARAKERAEFPAMVMFLTLSQKGKAEARRKMDLPGQMDLLKTVIGSSLRRGDAYTRYGNRHFILMLANAKKESCGIIFERIEKAYIKGSGKGNLWYHAEMTQKLEAKEL